MGRNERPTDLVSVSHYDLVLAAIPSVFVMAVLAGHLFAVPANVAVAAASLVATLALADALFINPPIEE
jgi:hypothetical protein